MGDGSAPGGPARDEALRGSIARGQFELTYVRDRLLRLGAPLIAFTFVVGPLTSLVGQRAQGHSSADDVGSFLIAKMQDADTGPMWFVTALLVSPSPMGPGAGPVLPA
jgi:hypothetical protein